MRFALRWTSGAVESGWEPTGPRPNDVLGFNGSLSLLSAETLLPNIKHLSGNNELVGLLHIFGTIYGVFNIKGSDQ